MQAQSPKNAPIDMEKWRELIDAWNGSGESQKAYCENKGQKTSPIILLMIGDVF